LPEKLNAGRRQRISGDHPLGSGRENLEVSAGKHVAYGIDLVGEDGKFDGLVVEPLAEFEVEEIGRLRQPESVRQVPRPADHQSILMEANGDWPTAGGGKGLLGPIHGRCRARQCLLDVRLCHGGRGDARNLDFLVRDTQPGADMIPGKYGRRRDNLDGTGGCARLQGYPRSGELVVRPSDAVVLRIKRPVRQVPCRIAASRNLLGRDIGMHDEQRIGALRPVYLTELVIRPGRAERGHPQSLPIDIHALIGQDEKIHLLGVELESDEATRAGCYIDESEAMPPRDAAGRMNEDVPQLEGAVFIGAQIAATEQLRRDLSGGEAGLLGSNARHHARPSSNVKSSTLGGVSSWASISLARRNSTSATF
jgi:hypothetical protein